MIAPFAFARWLAVLGTLFSCIAPSSNASADTPIAASGIPFHDVQREIALRAQLEEANARDRTFQRRVRDAQIEQLRDSPDRISARRQQRTVEIIEDVRSEQRHRAFVHKMEGQIQERAPWVDASRSRAELLRFDQRRSFERRIERLNRSFRSLHSSSSSPSLGAPVRSRAGSTRSGLGGYSYK